MRASNLLLALMHRPCIRPLSPSFQGPRIEKSRSAFPSENLKCVGSRIIVKIPQDSPPLIGLINDRSKPPSRVLRSHESARKSGRLNLRWIPYILIWRFLKTRDPPPEIRVRGGRLCSTGQKRWYGINSSGAEDGSAIPGEWKHLAGVPGCDGDNGVLSETNLPENNSEPFPSRSPESKVRPRYTRWQAPELQGNS